ncbi:MAG: hypothetical protein MRJ65_05315 [Candidatus Brocadiaceae bacterium]|nr:hypothetical protein [Candidatus Brocadiaceae bacterium]
MKIQRIYIDTSVIGGCFDQEFEKWSNGLIKDFVNGIYISVLSEIITVEINKAPEFVKLKYADILELKPEILTIGDESLALLQAYTDHNILGEKFRNDLLHIALATVSEVDILVSWNFKHIVHFDKIMLFNAVNIELGFKPLNIFSPREVTTYEQD